MCPHANFRLCLPQFNRQERVWGYTLSCPLEWAWSSKECKSVHIASQEIKHAKIDATINTGRVMKRLGCDGFKKEVSVHQDATSACGAEFRHAEKAPPHAEQGFRTLRRYLRMWRTFVRMRSWLSAREERTHLRIACGNGRCAVNCTFRLPYIRAYHTLFTD